MTDTRTTDPLGNLPRYVIFRGKRARVIGYEDNRFRILDHHDLQRLVTRSHIKFIKKK